MSSQNNSNMNYFRAVLQSTVIWAVCITIFESFQIILSTSARYIKPWDVFTITIVLFPAYFIIWSAILISTAFLSKYFWQKRGTSDGVLILSYFCIALFLYELFWILDHTLSAGLIYSSDGIFLLITKIIAAALTAYAAFKIFEVLGRKGYLQQTGLKLAALVFSMIAYMMVYIYIKSASKNEFLNPLYSVALFAAFLIFYNVLIYLIRKIRPILTLSTLTVVSRIKISIILLVSGSILFYYAHNSLAKKPDISSGPNILFISIDTLRADHLSCYGEINKNTSPNIDRIAQSGYIFKRAYSTTSWTLPGHASMMTGLFPSSHGADRSLHQTVSRPVDPLPASAVTIARILGDNGYRTAGIVSNPHLSASFGLGQGFQFYDDKMDLFEGVEFFSLREHSMLFKILQVLRVIDNNDFDGEQKVFEVNKKALDWLEKNKDKKSPFFLFLHYMDPHYLYEPPAPYNRSDDGRSLDRFVDIEKLNTGQFSLSSWKRNDLITLYDGEITYLDYNLGLLFSKFNELDLMDNTLIIITSDHGESFDEHEIWQHGNSLYEEQIRVPLIIRYPELSSDSHTVNEPIVQLVDLMPTILNVLEIPIPDSLQGRSLLPILKGESGIEFNLAFAELRPDIVWKSKNPRYGDGIRTVIDKEWKYILYDNGKDELYNLNGDPHEMNNLISTEKTRADIMKNQLTEWFNALTINKDNASEKIDSGRLQQLRSLGYLQ